VPLALLVTVTMGLVGMGGDGSCECDSKYFGSTCDISKAGMAIGIPVGVLAIALIVFVIKKRASKQEEGEYTQQLNALPDR
jgi:hypothetical protein